ncbi:hypothetical protein D3C80_1970810 [compost metagenome]
MERPALISAWALGLPVAVVAAGATAGTSIVWAMTDAAEMAHVSNATGEDGADASSAERI